MNVPLTINVNVRMSSMCKFAIWLVAKLPACALWSRVIQWLLNHLVMVKTMTGWVRVTGVKFGADQR